MQNKRGVRLWTIEYKNGYVGQTVYNWMTLDEVLQEWREYKTNFLRDGRVIRSQVFEFEKNVNSRGGFSHAFLTDAAYNQIAEEYSKLLQ